jgi:hypothetical protein
MALVDTRGPSDTVAIGVILPVVGSASRDDWDQRENHRVAHELTP